MNRNKRVNYYFIFTFIFIAMIPLIYLTFLKNQKGLVWDRDGLRQHYNALIYFGKWGREIIRNIFVHHNFEIPLWDFHIGYGSDIITTFHYYVIGDPLSLFSIFVPSKYTEYLYGALILLRIYLSGISFSFYCRYMGKNHTAVLGGALSYVFCGYVLYAGVRHPYFINPMIYLPLLLVGVEKIFQKKKPALFIFMVFLSAISNFYFFYMIVLAVCLYVAIRFFTFRHDNMIKDIFTTILKFSGFAVVGISMSAMILCPVLIQFFRTNRLDSKQSFSMFYNLYYYIKLIPSFLAPVNFQSWTILSFVAPTLLAVFVLFATRKKYLHLKISFCILTAMLLIPFCGKVFNGFAYISNRWCWIYAAFLSYIIATVWNEMIQFKNISKLFVLSASALYSIFFTAAQFISGRHSIHNIIPVIFLVCIITIALTASRFRTKANVLKAASAGFILIMLFHSCTNALFLYSSIGKNYVAQFVNAGNAYNQIIESAPAALKHIPKTNDDFYRYETDDLEVLNASTIVGESSVQFYWSLENRLVPRYLKDMALHSFMVHNYKDLDHRTYLDALAGVKYFIQKGACDIPYGFEYKDTICLTKENRYNVYENQYALPLGYTYDSCISYQEYKNMEDWERQEALLQGIVIESELKDEYFKDFPDIEPTSSASSVNYTVDYGKNVKPQSDGSLKVTKNKAEMTLFFTGLKNCETYLSIQGTKVEPDDPYENDLTFVMRSDDSENKMRHTTKTHKNFKNQQNYLINLGYHENAQTQISISLPKKGIYKFESMRVICQPMENYKTQIDHLKNNKLEEEKISTNTVAGKVNLSKDKILCFSIPYSHGWHAHVDDKKEPIVKANGMYMALPLTKGEHNIELHYQTPGLIAGFLFSVLGFIAFAVICIFFKKKNG